MKPRITFTYNVQTDQTKTEFSSDFSKLSFIQQLDFLQDMYIRVSLEYDKRLKATTKQKRKGVY